MMLYLNSLHLYFLKFRNIKPLSLLRGLIDPILYDFRNNCLDFYLAFLTRIHREKREQSQIYSPKVYDYTPQSYRGHYVFESGTEKATAYITANSQIPQPGDYLILPMGIEKACYQVTTIDRYSNSDSLWTALLTQVKL